MSYNKLLIVSDLSYVVLRTGGLELNHKVFCWSPSDWTWGYEMLQWTDWDLELLERFYFATEQTTEIRLIVCFSQEINLSDLDLGLRPFQVQDLSPADPDYAFGLVAHTFSNCLLLSLCCASTIENLPCFQLCITTFIPPISNCVSYLRETVLNPLHTRNENLFKWNTV